MLKTIGRSLLAASALTIGLSGPVSAVNVSVFFNSSFVDTGGEGANMVADLTALGYTVTTFTGTTAADFSAAAAGADALIFPEMERGDLNSVLDGAARGVLSNFVATGGNMVQANFFFGNSSLPNALFGWQLGETNTHSGSLPLDAAEAAGTVFAGGPANLDGADAVQMVRSATLPAGARNLYHTADETGVFSANVRLGCYTSLGYDWFEGPNASWRDVLGRAVQNSACTPVPEPNSLLLLALGAAGLGFVRRKARVA